jgi:hypothetical protein
MLRRRRSFGLSLIEVVAFIVIVGAGAVVVVRMLPNVMSRGPDSSDIVRATHLAQTRMELILGQRIKNGFSAMSDPCVPAAGAPAQCTPPTGFTVSASIQQWQTFPLTQYKQITVQVTAVSPPSSLPNNSTLSQMDSVVANY